jgi:hypothetical protein
MQKIDLDIKKNEILVEKRGGKKSLGRRRCWRQDNSKKKSWRNTSKDRLLKTRLWTSTGNLSTERLLISQGLCCIELVHKPLSSTVAHLTFIRRYLVWISCKESVNPLKCFPNFPQFRNTNSFKYAMVASTGHLLLMIVCTLLRYYKAL